MLCDVLDVSTSGYYASLRPRAEPAGRAARADSSGRAAGSRRVARHLRQLQDRRRAGRERRSGVGLPQHGGPGDAGIGPEKPRLEGLHADDDAEPIRRSSRRPTCSIATSRPTAPNRKWVTDITYLPTLGGLGLSGRRARPVQPQGRGLGARAIRWRRRWSRDALRQGDRIAAAGRQRALASQRSRLPVHQRRLSADLEDSGHRMLDESHRRAATITPSPSGSSGRSNTSGPSTRRSPTWKRRGSACSSTSKPFTIPCVFIRRSATKVPDQFEAEYAPVTSGVNQSPAAVRKSWAIALAAQVTQWSNYLDTTGAYFGGPQEPLPYWERELWSGGFPNSNSIVTFLDVNTRPQPISIRRLHQAGAESKPNWSR